MTPSGIETRITGTLHKDQYTYLAISRSVLLRIKNVSEKCCREYMNKIFCSVTFFLSLFFSKIVHFELMRKKYFRAVQATDDNMAHAPCMLDTYGYKQTSRICNTYCLSTATMVVRTHLNFTLFVQHILCLVTVHTHLTNMAAGRRYVLSRLIFS